MKHPPVSQTRLYALYHGDDYICDGTMEDLAKVTGLKIATVAFYASPTYERRLSRQKNQGSRSYVLIRLEGDD